MSEQNLKIEIEALRFFFKHKGEDLPDDILKALATWPDNTEVNKAVKTIIDVVIALEISVAMQKVIQEIRMLPKFPSGGIFSNLSGDEGGEYVINPKKNPVGGAISDRGPNWEHILPGKKVTPDCEKPFPWVDLPLIYFEPKVDAWGKDIVGYVKAENLNPSLSFEENDKGGGVFSAVITFIQKDDHAEESVEKNVQVSDQEKERPDGPGYFPSVDELGE